jgi:hypothetical protein
MNHVRLLVTAAMIAVTGATAASAQADPPPPPPPLIVCEDLCHQDPDYGTSLKHWVSDVRDWLLP